MSMIDGTALVRAREAANKFLGNEYFDSAVVRDAEIAVIMRIWLDGFGEGLSDQTELLLVADAMCRFQCRECGCTNENSCTVPIWSLPLSANATG